MIVKHIMNCIDEIAKDVNESSSLEVQELLKGLKRELSEQDREMMMKKVIMTSMTLCFSQGIMDDEFFEGAMIQNLDFLLKKVPYMKRSMLLKVELRGLENEVNRFIKVPYGIILADLCYLILASVNADGSHLFAMNINGEGRFGCDACDHEFVDDYAADVTIPELDMKVGSQMQLWYDFGEDYFFDIEVIDIEEHDHIQTIDCTMIEDGQGYGIWEDAHSLLNLYYENHQEFIDSIQEYGLDEDDFIFESFDVDAYNEMIIEEFEYLKTTYEIPEDFEE